MSARAGTHQSDGRDEQKKQWRPWVGGDRTLTPNT
jgi:hypothetical protein